MSDSTILESLVRNNKVIDNVNKRLDSLKVLFSSSPELSFTTNPRGFVYSDSVEAVTVYQNKDVTITIGTWGKEGDLWPDHCHADSLEFLIVTRGNFLVKIGSIPRFMGRGECATVPLGKNHSVTSLEKDSQMIGICIPPEMAYLVEELKCQRLPKKS